MITNTMKVVVCKGYGSPDVLNIEQVVKPIPKSDELLIKIVATTVNSGDVIVRSLKGSFIQKILMKIIFGWNKPRIPILGTVYAGIVEHVGIKVTDFRIGDEVFGLTGFKFSTYAEYITVKGTSAIALKPKNASFEDAAAILFGGQTAHYFLHKTNIYKVPNLDILVYGATSSVGTAALQIAKYYTANVTAVCSDYNEALVLQLGANDTIFYNKQDFTTTDKTFDIIFDAVGKISKKQCKSLLKPNGKFLTVGGIEYASETKEQLHFLKQLYEKGKFNSTIDHVYSMNEIKTAHHYVDTGRKKGNVVVKIIS